MKQFSFMFAGLAAAVGCIALADAVSTVDSTSLGVVKVALASGAEPAVGVPYTTTNGTSVTVASLVATGVAAGDQISVWDKDIAGYYVWEYTADGWEGATRTDSTETPSASTYTVAPGAALWYKPAAAGSIVIAGNVPTNCVSTTETGSASAPKFSLLANPFPTAVKLTNIAGAAGDQIVSLDSKKSYTYGTASGASEASWCTNGWTTVTVGDKTNRQATLLDASADKISGEGFWYISKGGHPTIDWTTVAE
ncbi:MAG: hypothetical protein K6F50_07895 [Kiritimatiellae bacterium]|nr:hypothetical protein [Kiritimatiellia bacterium]